MWISIVLVAGFNSGHSIYCTVWRRAPLVCMGKWVLCLKL